MERQKQDWQVREAPRRTVSLVGTVQVACGKQIRILIQNMSYQGCRFLSEHAFEVGEAIGLAVPGMGQVRAQVRWVKGDLAGVRFLLGNSAAEDRRARLGV